MKTDNPPHELKAGEIADGLLRVLYDYSSCPEAAEFSAAFLRRGREELMRRILECAVPRNAVQFFEFSFEQTWREHPRLIEQTTVSDMLAYLRTLHSKWVELSRFARGRKPRDSSGYELRADGWDNMIFISYPSTHDEVILHFRKLTSVFRPEVITITFYDEGPFLVPPSPDEKNHLTCWHNEPEEKNGTMIKWTLKDGEAYKFMEGNVAETVAALLGAGVRKIAIFEHHSSKPVSGHLDPD